jgi:hypothetical protein
MALRFKEAPAGIVCLAVSMSASADASGPAPEQAATAPVLEEVRVTAPRLRPAISPYIEADTVFGSADLAALAVDDLGTLLDELDAELDSGRGPTRGPRVVLINGQRVASFREIRRYPVEAVERVEIYAEDVALQYGFRADQKVVNFVLKPQFRALTARLAHTGYGDGERGTGGEVLEADAGYLRVRRSARLNLDVDSERQTALHESDREVPRPASDPLRDERPFRTLLPAIGEGSLSAGYADALGDSVALSLFGAYTRRERELEQGLADVDSDHAVAQPPAYAAPGSAVGAVPLRRELREERYDLNAGLRGQWRGVEVSWLSSYAQLQRASATVLGAEAQDVSQVTAPRAASVDARVQSDATRLSQWSSEIMARGVLLELPNGPLQGSLRALWQGHRQSAATHLDALVAGNRLQRDVAGLRLNLDAPLLRLGRGGRLSFNANSEVEDFSDAGSLSAFGAGLTWNSSAGLRLTSSITQEQAAPSLEQLGSPVSRLPQRRTFDTVAGEAVDAQQIDGGNPQLVGQTRTLWNINGRLRSPKVPGLALTFSYLDELTDHPIRAFPAQDADVEAAFPGLYSRDTRGSLVAFDTRPVNLDEEQRREFRWALRYRQKLPPTRRGATPEGAPMLRLSLNHVVTLRDELTLAPGIPAIDYLGVAQAGRRRDGAAHRVDLRSSFSDGGFTARLNASWQSPTRTRAPDGNNLFFDDLFRADLNLAYAFGAASDLVNRVPALANSRLRFTVRNLFDDKPRVRDALGRTPVGFTADELMPRGRHVALEFRKRFP